MYIAETLMSVKFIELNICFIAKACLVRMHTILVSIFAKYILIVFQYYLCLAGNEHK